MFDLYNCHNSHNLYKQSLKVIGTDVALNLCSFLNYLLLKNMYLEQTV